MSQTNSPRVTFSLFSEPRENPLMTVFSVCVLLYAAHIFGPIPIALLFLGIAVHEFGHYAAFKYYDMGVQQITVSIFNDSYVQTTESGYLITPKQQLLIALAGPLIGLAPLLVVIPAIYLTQSPELVNGAQLIFLVNLLNLVPYYGADGYKCYKSLKGIRNEDVCIADVSANPGAITWLVFIVGAVFTYYVFYHFVLF